MTGAHETRPRRAFRAGRWVADSRALPAEVPVALVYSGTTQAVMMATPADLVDFARGFSLTEGLVAEASALPEPEVVETAAGIELRMWLAPDDAARFQARRRAMVGPVGCGLCGIDSLAEALPPPRSVAGAALRLAPADIAAAMAGLARHQQLHDATRAAHAAAFWRPGEGIVAAREDVGRHNALDKLAGALAARGLDPATGAVVMTSRVSVDLVQKVAAMGAGVLIAASAPTALAVAQAEAAGLTLVALARGAEFELFTHPHRLSTDEVPDVA